MHNKRLMAAFLSLSVAVGSLCSGSWGDALAKENLTDSHVEIYQRVPHINADGMVHFTLEDSAGNEVILPTGAKKSTQKKAAVLPASYDPRGTDRETPIRDQEDTGACWTFGALKALETDCITKGILSRDQADLSENHLAWYAYHRLQDKQNPLYGDYMKMSYSSEAASYDAGGNAYIAQYILANRWGAAWEEAAPFSVKADMAKTMLAADDSLRFESAIHLTDTQCFDPDPNDPFNEEDRNEIKAAVMEHGAMNVSLYYGNSIMYNHNGVISSYTSQHTVDDANHSVTIVGWDDDFDTFWTKTPAPGAWLIANSYGTDYNEQGYYWVSYYDTSLCEFYTFEGVAGDTYETAYQYDGMGWGNAYVSDQDIKIANVFTSDSTQSLEAVSFYTALNDQPYTIEIYRNLQGSNPKSGERVSRCRVSGTIAREGYHTIALTEPIAVATGEAFSAIVTYHPVDGTVYAPIEGKTERRYGLYYSGKQGQSYVYFADEEKWFDNTLVDLEGSLYNMNNVCVKVFGNPVSEEEYEAQEAAYIPESPEPDPTKKPTPAPTSTVTASNTPGASVTGIPASATPVVPSATKSPAATSSPGATAKISCKSKYVIGKGEKFTLPLNRTSVGGQATLTFGSSDPKVVKVDQNGKITGKKIGTAKITIKAISGAKKVVTITVKKAPKKIHVKGKTSIKKGRSTKLKVTLSKGSASYKLRYRSSNKKIATVNSGGKVVGKKRGTVRIYAYTYNNKKSSVKITVR